MATSITLIKRMTYRASTTEEWSNKYHFTGTDPATPADWLALLNALIVQEKTLYPSTHVIVRAYGYVDDASTAGAVYSRDLVAAAATVPGTYNSTGNGTPGDVAAWIRWKTDRLSVKGKPIYLRKYYHGVFTSGTSDTVASVQTTAYNAFAAKMWDGTFLDARKVRAPGRSSETILGASSSQYTTTRTLKRRGKRPA